MSDITYTVKHAQLLEDAADLIETYGHKKFALGDRYIGFCALGALCEAETQLGQGMDLFSEAVYAVTSYIGIGLCTLACWNNKAERTAPEVIDAFRGTAKEIRNLAITAT